MSQNVSVLILTLNEEIKGEDGTLKGIRNDVSQLKQIRHKVIISDTQESPTEKMHNVAILSELVERTPETSVATRTVLMSDIVENIDQIPVETKAKLKAVGELELELAMENLQLNIENAKLQRTTIEQQLTQMQAAGGAPAVPGAAGALPPPEEEVPDQETLADVPQESEQGMLPENEPLTREVVQ